MSAPTVIDLARDQDPMNPEGRQLKPSRPHTDRTEDPSLPPGIMSDMARGEVFGSDMGIPWLVPGNLYACHRCGAVAAASGENTWPHPESECLLYAPGGSIGRGYVKPAPVEAEMAATREERAARFKKWLDACPPEWREFFDAGDVAALVSEARALAGWQSADLVPRLADAIEALAGERDAARRDANDRAEKAEAELSVLRPIAERTNAEYIPDIGTGDRRLDEALDAYRAWLKS